ncbi:MarR family winged helix-turn-helix transcriptional regulator [Streptomyces aurantiacus]|uniref:MarR family transcriptional regulator n=1 Tax=Streptomyces aurantiacus TaxID=47760 RepID=A0A7G1PBL9_9ACTN|nr:MarR family transcriptional regulator [Streptomyces aurantiacus]BCL33023.1 MarR family transcriptional regulator [Streptomyces aurantiacus]
MAADADPAPLSPDQLQLWQSLGRLVHSLPRALEDDMSRTGVTMTEFAVLLILSSAPGHRMRMSALADAAGLTPSRITRLVDGLGKHGLVSKERHGHDGRGNEAVLTDSGLRTMRAARPAHLASARRRVLDRIPDALVPALAETLTQLADALSRERGPDRG